MSDEPTTRPERRGSNGQTRTMLFILGIQRRSGTNFLSDLLAAHPQCRKVRTIWEDFLVAHAEHLEEYVDAVAGSWSPGWDPDGRAREQLREALGEACVRFLFDKTREGRPWVPRYLVSKSPTVENLELVGMFPRSKALVLVRDGRAVVESGVRSFGWDFAGAARQWAHGADTILRTQARDVPFLLLRYEDLVRDPRAVLLRIFAAVGLDPARYDFAAAEAMPVRGSSEVRERAGDVHWRRVERSDDFDPLARFAHWSVEQHAVFNEIAGAQLDAFGYEPVRT